MKYRNFRRLTDAGPVRSGLESVFTLLLAAVILIFLAYYLRDNIWLAALFTLPVVACLYGVWSELSVMYWSKSNQREGE